MKLTRTGTVAAVAAAGTAAATWTYGLCWAVAHAFAYLSHHGTVSAVLAALVAAVFVLADARPRLSREFRAEMTASSLELAGRSVVIGEHTLTLAE